MPLASNSRLGPYEIKSTLGVGGMGEVYRAHDSRLNRDVAIKVLRVDSASGSYPDLRSRFEREARAVAALNHPNIIAVYDFGIESGQQYIVSELVEGESLRSLLKSKPVPVRRLIELATQVSDGLAAAHSAGIVHRDLKPENIMLGKDGRARIVDFGLARRASSTISPTIPPGSDETFVPPTQNLTSAGAVLGTAAYMSPEQAHGKETDYRSDQFSFGLILYEMASGKQAFARSTNLETMAAIVSEEPPAIEERIPAPLKWIIDRCFNKEPEQRYESTLDLYRDLKSLRDHFSDAYSSIEVLPSAAVSQTKPRSWSLPTLAVACAAFTALLGYLMAPAGENFQNYRYTPLATDVSAFTWSPDGTAIAYSARVNGVFQVFLRYLSSPAATQLTHVRNDTWVEGWSGDRSHIIFAAFENEGLIRPAKLYSVALVGGEPEFIMDRVCELFCDISRDGKVLADLIRDKDGYFRVVVSDPLGSSTRPYTPSPFSTREQINNFSLNFSPDDKKLLLVLADKHEAWLLPYPDRGGSPRRLLSVPEILFGRRQSISWLPDNRHIVVSASPSEEVPGHLWLADTESRGVTQLTTGTHDEMGTIVSPDGQSILFNENKNEVDIVGISLEDGFTHPVISTGHKEFGVSWAANQAKLTWITSRSGPLAIWLRTPDGSEHPIVTAADLPSGFNGEFMNTSVSPNGERLIFSAWEKSGPRLLMSSVSGGTPVLLTKGDHNYEIGGTWSPDGRFFAFESLQNNEFMLMVAKTSGGSTPAILKSNVSFSSLSWSPTGNWIAYRDQKGWNLVTLDGKNKKFLGNIDSSSLVFSKDGKLLYGLVSSQDESGEHRVTLFSLDPTTLKQRTIKQLASGFRVYRTYEPLSLTPDGKTLVTSMSKEQGDLWILQGYRQPSIWNRIKNAFHLNPQN